jgi:hypothetical protein
LSKATELIFNVTPVLTIRVVLPRFQEDQVESHQHQQ